MKLEIISPTNDGSTMTRSRLLTKHVDTTSLIERREEKAVLDFDTLIFAFSEMNWDLLGCRVEEVLGFTFFFFFSLNSYKCLSSFGLQAEE